MHLALMLYKGSIYALDVYSLIQLWLLRRAAAAPERDSVAKESKRIHHNNMIRSVVLIVILVLIMLFVLSPAPYAVWVPLHWTHDASIVSLSFAILFWRRYSERLWHWRQWYYDLVAWLYLLIAVTGAELVREIPLALPLSPA